MTSLRAAMVAFGEEMAYATMAFRTFSLSALSSFLSLLICAKRRLNFVRAVSCQQASMAVMQRKPLRFFVACCNGAMSAVGSMSEDRSKLALRCFCVVLAWQTYADPLFQLWQLPKAFASAHSMPADDESARPTEDHLTP